MILQGGVLAPTSKSPSSSTLYHIRTRRKMGDCESCGELRGAGGSEGTNLIRLVPGANAGENAPWAHGSGLASFG